MKSDIEMRKELISSMRKTSYHILSVLVLAVIAVSFVVMYGVTLVKDFNLVDPLFFLTMIVTGIGVIIIEFYIYAIKHLNNHAIKTLYEKAKPILKNKH